MDLEALRDEFASNYPIGLRRTTRVRWVEEADGEEYLVPFADDTGEDFIFRFQGRLPGVEQDVAVVLPVSGELIEAVDDPARFAEMIWPSVEPALKRAVRNGRLGA